MLTMGTDTGGSSSQPPSWRSRAVAAMLRSRETKSQNPSDHVSSVCGMAAVAGERGLMHVSTLRVTVVVEIQIQGTYRGDLAAGSFLAVMIGPEWSSGSFVGDSSPS